jgi:dipeptidyl aminopeptidase/acylaminoacyl peptidase
LKIAHENIGFMRNIKNFLAIGVLLSCLVAETVAQTVLAPLPAEAALRMWSFGIRSPIDLSPDGKWVAYTLTNQARRESPTNELHQVYRRTGASRAIDGSVLWLTNVKSGESHQVIEGTSRSWAGSWSPDGRYLAFYSDRDGEAGLWVWEKSTGQVRRVSSAIARPFFEFEVPQWTPDSKKVLIKVLPEGLSLEEAAKLLINTPRQDVPSAIGNNTSTVMVFNSFPKARTKEMSEAPPSSTSVWSRYLADLALIDTTSGSVQRLVRQCKAATYYLSPDGANIAFTDYRGFESLTSQQTIVDIIVLPTSGSESRVLVRNARMSYGRNISWSPNSQSISYVTSGPLAKGDCFLVPLDTGKPRNLTEGIHPSFGDDYRQPLWDASGQTIYCVGERNLWAIPVFAGKPKQVTKGLEKDVREIVAPSGKGRVRLGEGEQSIYVSTRDSKTMQVGFYRVELRTGKNLKLIEENGSYGAPLTFSMDVSDDGQQVIYLAEDVKHSADIWLSDPSFHSPRRVTHTNPSFDGFGMGASQIVQWKGDDGESIEGALLLPAGYEEGKRYPMIVELYSPRNQSGLVNRFGLGFGGIANFQLWASRGYAVFFPNIPLKVGMPMRSISSAVLPGVNKIIDMGIADPDRLAVMGTSYGGYCVLALLVQTTRFKAGVSSAGFGNIIGFYGSMQSAEAAGIGWAEEGQGSMGGTPWDFRQRYIENSPIFYLDGMTTPLLLVHGASDTTVPAFLSEEVFIDLRRLHKEVTYLKYPGGEHGAGSFNYVDSLDYFGRMISFFDDKLKKPHQ